MDRPSDRVCERADSLHSGRDGCVSGRVILACGDVAGSSKRTRCGRAWSAASSAGAVARREIDLDSTLADFSIDERTPLTSAERSATSRQVISARSGVYRPAAYGASQDRRRPVRRSHLPGTHWF
jgi:hypothetical protein